MTIALIIVVLLAMLLAVALYFQVKASHKASEKTERLLKDYQKRVDEQQRLLEDYRSLEKNFDNVGQGYEQALLAFDKMEEERQKMQQTKQVLEQKCHDLQESNSQLTALAHRKYDALQQLLSQASEALSKPDGAKRVSAILHSIANLGDLGSQTAIECSDNVAAETIAQKAVADSGILDVNFFDFDVKIAPEAGSRQLRTSLNKASQALTALLDNAIKFTTQGHVVLSADIDGDKLRFAVEDTGLGIAAEDAERAFEPFTQLNTYFDGLGVGLAAAQSIAQRLGGDIAIDTAFTGPGTRIVLSLPL